MRIAFVMFCVLVSPPYSPLLRPWSLQAPAAPDETITIDGSKSPELVPQWAAWAQCAGVDVSTGVYALPTSWQRASPATVISGNPDGLTVSSTW